MLLPALALTATVGVQPAAAAPVPYTYTKVVSVALPVTGAKQQALGYANGHLFVGFDAGTSSHITEYTSTGTKVRDVGSLNLGHAAEMGYRKANGKFYVANGGPDDKAKVAVVNMAAAKPTVEDTYDFSTIGVDAMVAVDNDNDRMVLFGGPKRTEDTISFGSFSSRTREKAFDMPNLGTPNGLEVVGSKILYLATLKTSDKQDRVCNTMTAFNFTGTAQYALPIPVIGEGEGLAADQVTGQLYVGFKSPNSVYKVSPAWTTPLGSNLLANGDAECNDPVDDNTKGVDVAGWSDSTGTGTNMTVISYGANSGYPGSSSPGPSPRGTSFFSGGTAAVSTLTQTVNLTGFAAGIDSSAGTRYTLSGYLGGYGKQEDNAKVVVTFRNSSGTTLGTKQLEPVTAANRGNETGLRLRTASDVVPAGARSASVVVTATRAGGTNNDGYSDNVSLVLGA